MPLMLRAGVRAVPGVDQEPGPELQGVLEADMLGCRHDRLRGLTWAISTTDHEAQDRRPDVS
jgi:hypothetical protein